MIPSPESLVERGPYMGSSIIGEITERLHEFLREGWLEDLEKARLPDGMTEPELPPRIEEDLAFEPKDREKVLYVYMYRVARNTALMNSKRFRESNVELTGDDGEVERFYQRPPLYLDVYYLVSVHARFRSEAEKLLGWTLLRLNDATHLVYRPRKYRLPDGRVVDSVGRPWSLENTGEGVIMEKVSLDLVDDLDLGDAVHFFNIHEAPFRPFVTYRARCAMEGSLVEGKPTVVRSLPLANTNQTLDEKTGVAARDGAPRSSRARLGRPERPSAPPRTQKHKMPFGPDGFDQQKIADPSSETDNED